MVAVLPENEERDGVVVEKPESNPKLLSLLGEYRYVHRSQNSDCKFYCTPFTVLCSYVSMTRRRQTNINVTVIV